MTSTTVLKRRLSVEENPTIIFNNKRQKRKAGGHKPKFVRTDSNQSTWNSNPPTPNVDQSAYISNIQQTGNNVTDSASSSPSPSPDESALAALHPANENTSSEETGQQHSRNETSAEQPSQTRLDQAKSVDSCAQNDNLKPAVPSAKRYSKGDFVKGVFEILHVTDDETATYIVRNCKTRDYGLCREISVDKYRKYIKLYERFFDECTDEDEHVLQRAWPDKTELFMTKDGLCYHVSPRHYGTLHSFVIDKKKLSEEETLVYFKQILEIVSYCHDRGIVVRDVKLRKFVFVDEQRTSLRLDDLDEFFVCPDIENDTMSDRHGCPAYVSPEILDLNSKVYAGKPADIWGLGVLLYVLLLGRYPFYDSTPTGLFAKIRSGRFLLNEQSGVSLELRWLIRSLLRMNPDDRPLAREILVHPWMIRKKVFNCPAPPVNSDCQDFVKNLFVKFEDSASDQCVPSLEPVFLKLASSKSLFLESRDQEVFASEL